MFRCIMYAIFRENLLTLAQNHLLFGVVLYVGCVIGYKIHTFVEVLTTTESIFCSLVCMLKNLKNASLKSLICSALMYLVS